MKRRHIAQIGSRRQVLGDALIDRAAAIDTAAVADRLATFTAVHRGFVALQQRVASLQLRTNEGLARADRVAARLDARIDDLAVAMVVERRPLRFPFARYTSETPYSLKQRTRQDKPAVVLGLGATMRADHSLSPKTLAVIDAAEAAARELALVVDSLTRLEGELRAALHDRDQQAAQWDNALAALKISARLAARDGAGAIQATLFIKNTQPRRRPATTPAQPDTPAAA